MSSFFDESSLCLIPSGYKTSKLYSVKPTDGTGDLTFTRSNDTATRVGPDGLIEKVRTNLLLRSNAFDTTWSRNNVNTPTANAIANPLTGAVDAWKLVEDATTNFHYILNGPTFAAGEVSFSFYAKAAERTTCSAFLSQAGNFGGSFNLSTGVATASGTGTTASMVALPNDWYRCIVTNNGSATVANQVRIGVADGALGSYAGDGTSGIYIYAAQAEQGVATDYIATTTAAVSVGPVANVPRLDYSGGATCPSLLLEPQRTNYLTYSNFNAADWSQTTASVSVNTAISPDGYQNAHTATRTSGSDNRVGVAKFSATIGQPYTNSIYLRKVSGSGSVNIADINNTSTTFELTSEWARYSTTATAIASTQRLYVNMLTDGDVIEFWEGQIENGAYPTSLIPTQSSAVTRGADACSKTGISSLIGQTEGTLFIELDKDFAAISERYLGIGDGTTANRIIIIGGASGAIRAFISASSVTQFDEASIPAVGNHKIAIAYANNDIAFYVDGLQIALDTSATIPAVGNLYVGTHEAGSLEVLNGGLNQALLFKTRLTNAQLAELTTL